MTQPTRVVSVSVLALLLLGGAAALEASFSVTSPRTTKSFVITVTFDSGIGAGTVMASVFSTTYTSSSWPQAGAAPCTIDSVAAPVGNAYDVSLTCTAGQITFALDPDTIYNDTTAYSGSVNVDFTPAVTRSSTAVAHDGVNPVTVVYDYVFNVNASTFSTVSYVATGGSVDSVTPSDNTVSVVLLPSGTAEMSVVPASTNVAYDVVGSWPAAPVVSTASTTSLAFEYSVPLVTVSSTNPGMHSGAGSTITIDITVSVELLSADNLTSADFVGSGYTYVPDSLVLTASPSTRFWSAGISVTGTATVRFGIRAGAVSSKTTGFANGASNQLAFVYSLQDGIIRPVGVTATAALGAGAYTYGAVSITGGVSSRSMTVQAYEFGDILALEFERVANPAIPTIAIAAHTMVLALTSADSLLFRSTPAGGDSAAIDLTWAGNATGSRTAYVHKASYLTGIKECTTGGGFTIDVDVTYVNSVDVSGVAPSTYFESGVTKLTLTRGDNTVPAVSLMSYADLVTYFAGDDAPPNPSTAVYAQAEDSYKLFAFYRPCVGSLASATGDRATFWPENTTLSLTAAINDVGATSSPGNSLEGGTYGWAAPGVDAAFIASCASCGGSWPSTLGAGIFNWSYVAGTATDVGYTPDAAALINHLSAGTGMLALSNIGALSWSGAQCGDESVRFVPLILFPGLDTSVDHELHARVSIGVSGTGVTYAASPATTCTSPAYTPTTTIPVMKVMNMPSYAPTTLDAKLDANPVDTRVFFGQPTLVGDNEIEFTVSVVLPTDCCNTRRALTVISVGTQCLVPTIDGGASMIRFPASSMSGTCMNVPSGFEAATLTPDPVVEDTAVEDLWYTIFTTGRYPSNDDVVAAADSGVDFAGVSTPFFPQGDSGGVLGSGGFKVVSMAAEEGAGKKAVYTFRGSLNEFMACKDMLGTSLVVPLNDEASGKITYQIPITVQRFVAGDTVAKTTLSLQCVHHTVSVTVSNNIVQMLSAYAQGITVTPAVRSIEPEVCTACDAASGTGGVPGYACPGSPTGDEVYWRLRVMFSLTISKTASVTGGDTGPLDTYLVPFVAAPTQPSPYLDFAADESSIAYTTEGDTSISNVFVGVVRSICVNTYNTLTGLNDRNVFLDSTNFNLGVKLQQLRSPGMRWSVGLAQGVTDLSSYNLYGTADVHLSVQYADGIPSSLTAAAPAFMAHELSMWPDPEYRDATDGTWRQNTGMTSSDRLDGDSTEVVVDAGSSIVLVHKLTNTLAVDMMQLHNREVLACVLQPASPYYHCIAGDGGSVAQKVCPTGNDAWLSVSCNKADWATWIATTAAPTDLSPAATVYSFLREYTPTTPIAGAPAAFACRYDLKTASARLVAGTRTYFCEGYNPTTQLVTTLKWCGTFNMGSKQHDGSYYTTAVTQWQLLPSFASPVSGADATEISFIGLPTNTQYYISVVSTAYDCRLGVGSTRRLLFKYDPEADPEPRYLRGIDDSDDAERRDLTSSDPVARNDVSAGITFMYGTADDAASMSIGIILLSVIGGCLCLLTVAVVVQRFRKM